MSCELRTRVAPTISVEPPTCHALRRGSHTGRAQRRPGVTPVDVGDPRVPCARIATADRRPRSARRVHAGARPPANVVAQRSRAGTWERIGRGIYLPTTPSADSTGRRRSPSRRIVGLHAPADVRSTGSATSPRRCSGGCRCGGRRPSRTSSSSYAASSGRDPPVSGTTRSPPGRASVTVARRAARHHSRTDRRRLRVDPAPAATGWSSPTPRSAPAPTGRARARSSPRRGPAAEASPAHGRHRARRRGAESPGESAAGSSSCATACQRRRRRCRRHASRHVLGGHGLGASGACCSSTTVGPSTTGGEADEFIREKRRHDAILEAGWRSVRVTKEDLARPTLAPSASSSRPARPPRATRRLRPSP